jgi:hypothetical protein
MPTTPTVSSDILFPGSVMDIPHWYEQLKGWWNEVRGPGYVVWFSEPLWSAADRGWLVRVERTRNCHPKGVEIYEGLIATTLRCLPGSRVVAEHPGP